jgi:putative transposase
VVKPATKREVVDYLVSEYPINIRQACKSLNFEQSSYYYHPKKQDDSEVIDCLNTLSEKHPSYGFKKMFHSLRNQGFGWNHKKVYRVYKKLGLNLVRKRRRRLASIERQNLEVPNNYNEIWSMDFMSDALFNSRRFRTLNIIDDYNREAIWMEIGLSIGAIHMTDLLEWVIKERGKPKAIRTDNGPEFTSTVFTNWCHKHRIEIRYIQPGKPVQNAFIERFNRSYRTEVLDARIFNNLVEVREITQEWMEHYNYHRPHESLENLSPMV